MVSAWLVVFSRLLCTSRDVRTVSGVLHGKWCSVRLVVFCTACGFCMVSGVFTTVVRVEGCLHGMWCSSRLVEFCTANGVLLRDIHTRPALSNQEASHLLGTEMFVYRAI